jgi:hypothetical protein
MVELAALTVLVVGVVEGWSQTGSKPKPPPPAGADKAPARSKLEEALAEALKNNPDLRVAAAKVNEAEAELHRARLQVVQKVVNAYRAIDEAKAEVAAAEAHRNEAMTPQALRALQDRFLRARQKLAAAEADLDYLLGKTPKATAGVRASAVRALTRMLVTSRARKVLELQGPSADRIRAALDRRVHLSLSGLSARDVLARLRSDNSGLHIQASTTGSAWDERITANLKDVPLGAVLQLLEDCVSGHRIVVREYGLLIVPQERLPPGALLLGDFWKGQVEPAKTGTPLTVEGVVKKVDATGLMVVSVGSDAKVVKGLTLEVYRLGATPKYLGRVLVVDVTPTEAVCKPSGRLLEPVKVGDRVSSRLSGR